MLGSNRGQSSGPESSTTPPPSDSTVEDDCSDRCTSARDSGLVIRQSERVPDDVDIALGVERWFESHGFRVETRASPDGVVVDLVGNVNPDVILQHYASAPTAVLAVLAAEQRWLVEEQGSGSVRGETYVEKAEERLRRARE